MTVKLSELRVSASMDASKYQAGMFEKVAADNAGAASSQRLGQSMTQSYQRISQAGNVVERLARTYVTGYAEATKFDSALRSLGRGLETGKVSLDQAGAILDGVTTKFGRSADATALATAGYTKLAKAVADYNAAGKASTSATSAGAINQRMGIQSPPEGSANRAADIEAYGKSLDDLRAKYAPLYAVERNHHAEVAEITKAHKVGAISSEELSAALATAQGRFVAQSHAVRESNAAIMAAGKGATLSSNAMANLSFQINDVATQAALGMPPLRILAAQGGQFFQILQQGEGGVSGSLSYLYRTVTGLVTPFRLATAGAAGLAAAGVLAAISWRSAQREISVGLIGVGSAAGTTVRDINAIADAAARSGQATVGEARRIALAYAATGRIGPEVSAQLTSINRQIDLVFGEGAAEKMAKAFADPAKGVDEINARLLVFNASEVQHIKNLDAQGLRYDAQKLQLGGLKTGLEQAAAQTSLWTKAWDGLAGAASRAWAAVGGAGASDNSLDSQLARARGRLEAAQHGYGVRGGRTTAEDVAAAASEVQRLESDIRKVSATQRSLDFAAAIDGAGTLETKLRDANNRLENLRNKAKDSDAWKGLAQEGRDAYRFVEQGLKDEIAGLEIAKRARASAVDLAKQENALALQGINARTAAQRAEIAYQQTLARESRAGNPAALVEAEAARIQVLAQENRRVGDEIRNRNFAAQQAIDLATLELSLIGKSADDAARITAAFQAKQQALAQAFQGNRSAGADEIAAAEDLALRKAAIESRTRRAQFVADLEFERAQLGRTPAEQSVYSRMQSAGLLTDGQIVGTAAQSEAAMLRLTEIQRQAIDNQKEFASSFIHDMMAGTSATEALGDALGNLSEKLLSSSLDKLFSGLFQSGAYGTGGTAGAGAGLFGGSILPGILHDGGVAGSGYHPTRSVPASIFAAAPRYHGGGFAGLKPDEVPAILQKGERVLSRREVAAGDGGGASPTINVITNIHAQGAYPESINEIRAAIAARDAALPGQVVATIRAARERRMA